MEILAFLSLNSYLCHLILLKRQYDRPGDLITRDTHITEDFLFVKCHPLLHSVMRLVFDYEVDYGEMVNELYLYLMEDDAAKLRNFQYRSSVYQWLKVLSVRFFVKKCSRMIEDRSGEALYDKQNQTEDDGSDFVAAYDLERLFQAMPTKRYVYVIRRLILEHCEPEVLAQEMNITIANLYNIKWHSVAQLTRIALNDINEYGK